jgi:hypothetical protein
MSHLFQQAKELRRLVAKRQNSTQGTSDDLRHEKADALSGLGLDGEITDAILKPIDGARVKDAAAVKDLSDLASALIRLQVTELTVWGDLAQSADVSIERAAVIAGIPVTEALALPAIVKQRLVDLCGR